MTEIQYDQIKSVLEYCGCDLCEDALKALDAIMAEVVELRRKQHREMTKAMLEQLRELEKEVKP